MRHHHRAPLALFGSLLLAAGCSKSSDPAPPPVSPDPPPGDPVPPEVAVGERLFREPRFAQFFAVNAGGDLNQALPTGDRAVETIVVDGVEQVSPFADSTQSCASCHLSDQGVTLPGGGVRAWTDFAKSAKTTERADGVRETARKVAPLVDLAHREGGTFHADGEYASLEAAIEGALLGRKLGWMANERDAAVANLAAVLRADDGTTANGLAYGGVPYAQLFDVDAVDVPIEYAMPEHLLFDFDAATDEELVDGVVAVIAEYLAAQELGRDASGNPLGSPYDAFLAENELPRQADLGESDLEYARRLAAELDALTDPVFIEARAVEFETHDQDFAFGALELEGLRTFLREPGAAGAVGNCVACHTPPRFTDDLFRNTGVTQAEYDAEHAVGAFFDMPIPSLAERSATPGIYLPASPTKPLAPEALRHRARGVYPDLADLGVWNVFANPLMPDAQAPVRAALEAAIGPDAATMTDDELLSRTIATFRTPSLRDLGHKGPFGHNGMLADLDAVLAHYVAYADLARMDLVRNADPALADVAITPADSAALVAFLRSLNEDLD